MIGQLIGWLLTVDICASKDWDYFSALNHSHFSNILTADDELKGFFAIAYEGNVRLIKMGIDNGKGSVLIGHGYIII